MNARTRTLSLVGAFALMVGSLTGCGSPLALDASSQTESGLTQTGGPTSPAEQTTSPTKPTKSPSKGANSGSKEDACAYLEAEINAYAETVLDELTEATESYDFVRLIQIEKEMLTEYQAIGATVKNSEVRDSFLTVISITKEMMPYLEQAFSDPASAADLDLTELTERVTDEAMKFSLICPSSDAVFLG